MLNVMQIIGAVGIGVLLDNRKIPSRRARGVISILVVAIIIVAGWIGLTVWLYENPMDPLNPTRIDWTDKGFGGFLVINLIFGLNLVIVSYEP